ncbi:hypothetical protein [Pseudalkalibacillus caeni]|uniref:Uncharacterized protein n=1 Tax=Exobacillus caeni TaxID=2574798 RepID=A0A5R9FA34_9BACL|nr:hypothetical protein [Pseudalkalibacillus caeni]TLS37723.1 hypothetical protein FCL54_07825 [Pseudalkalibacillus caeni]
MYRPTVRYGDVYRDFVKELQQVTSLDANQIIRLALFAAPFNRLFRAQVKERLKSDVPLPSPAWEAIEHGYWLEQSYKPEEEKGDDVNVELARRGPGERIIEIVESRSAQEDKSRCVEQIPRREWKVPSGEQNRTVLKNQNGIKFNFN